MFEQFVLDVNLSPDDLRPVDQLTFRRVLDFAGLEPPTIAAVPVAFHLAEKLHAYVRIYAGSRPSSRVKDLYDMLVMARALPIPDERRAPRSSFDDIRVSSNAASDGAPGPASDVDRSMGRVPSRLRNRVDHAR